MKLDDRAAANMDVALEQAFRGLPHGGDHESRKQVARKLIKSARAGNTTLGSLSAIAKSALQKLRKAADQ